MRTFALATIAASAAAFGTTGHYGNQYGHGGHDDHAHEDHIYGYDSVPADYDIADQTTRVTNIITQIRAANDDRKSYLTKIQSKRQRRLEEIRDDNIAKIDAPFDYQTRLLNEEEDDILVANGNAIRDSNDAFNDLEARITVLKDDILEDQAIEVEKIKNAISRSVVDQKNPALVLYALRIDWLAGIEADPSTTTATGITGVFDFDIYDDIFSDFHYDIGHGKASGEGKIDTAPIVDGWDNRNAPAARGPVGDYERDIGAQTRAWEMPGSRWSGRM